MKYLITYEDGLKLIEAYDDFNFSKSEFILEGYKVVTFTYFLCDFKHFETPLKEDPKIKGYDMRGATFVFNKDGSLYKRFLMLPKFFNLNQVENTLYGVVKDKEIAGVAEKEDGSLIAVMELPNGSLFPKTIGSFDNEQTAGARKILENNEDLKYFIKDGLKVGYTPLFEYVSWDNRIVLKYSKPELRFLGVRDNYDGRFIGVYDRDWHLPVKTTKVVENLTLDELIAKGKVEEDKEGWVVEFTDGQMIKVKTDWYFNLHGIRTMNIFREDWVIKNYLEEKLDDIISQLDEKEDEDAFKFVERVKLAVDTYIKNIDEGVSKLVKVYEDEYDSKWHYFAKFNNKEPFFGLSVIAIQRPESYNQRKLDFIINKTKHLKKAQFFVDKWSGTSDKFITKWNK